MILTKQINIFERRMRTLNPALSERYLEKFLFLDRNWVRDYAK